MYPPGCCCCGDVSYGSEKQPTLGDKPAAAGGIAPVAAGYNVHTVPDAGQPPDQASTALAAEVHIALAGEGPSNTPGRPWEEGIPPLPRSPAGAAGSPAGMGLAVAPGVGGGSRGDRRAGRRRSSRLRTLLGGLLCCGSVEREVLKVGCVAAWNVTDCLLRWCLGIYQ